MNLPILNAWCSGLEILLIFTDGNFDASGTTFMLSDWLAHTPLEIVAQNLGVNTSVLANIPAKDPYILESTVSPPPFGDTKDQAVADPNGEVPSPFVFHLDKQEKTMAPGGWVKIQDSASNFPVSTLLASALVFVEPNGLRELHWHVNDGAHSPHLRAIGTSLTRSPLLLVLPRRVAAHHQRPSPRDRVRRRQHRADV